MTQYIISLYKRRFLILLTVMEIIFANILWAQDNIPQSGSIDNEFAQKTLEQALLDLDSPFLKKRNEAEDWITEHYSEWEIYWNQADDLLKSSFSYEARHRLCFIQKRWKKFLKEKAFERFSGKIIEISSKKNDSRLKKQAKRSFDIFNAQIIIDLPDDHEIIRLSFDPSTFYLNDRNNSRWSSATSSSMQETDFDPISKQANLFLNIRKEIPDSNKKSDSNKTTEISNKRTNENITKKSDNSDQTTLEKANFEQIKREETESERINREKSNIEQFIQSGLTCSATVASSEKEFRFDNIPKFGESEINQTNLETFEIIHPETIKSESNLLKIGETTVSILQFVQREDQCLISISIQFENAHDALESFRSWILKKRMELLLTNPNNETTILSPQNIRQRSRTTNSVSFDVLFSAKEIINLSQQSISFRCFLPTYLFNEAFRINLSFERQSVNSNFKSITPSEGTLAVKPDEAAAPYFSGRRD